MARRRPLVAGSGQPSELPAGDRLAGFWAKAIAVPVGGAVSATIPAGIFAALPVVGHSIEAAGTRDYVLRISGRTLNADKTITLTGVVRQSRMLPGTLLVSGGNETFETLTSAVTLHLVAMESD
ncbi:MAG: hypothetical protein Q7T93_16740 [Methylobacterium sp.]|uniref:hypothetical protein n=1 Tax=Methylobacterium sp. TaxID=409 RepID=UPI002720E354|nr:hypothetical protein [Methylobacterium sp.]MDO9428466.1 hypothetical protein [Methylobacterium sp.]